MAAPDDNRRIFVNVETEEIILDVSDKGSPGYFYTVIREDGDFFEIDCDEFIDYCMPNCVELEGVTREAGLRLYDDYIRHRLKTGKQAELLIKTTLQTIK